MQNKSAFFAAPKDSKEIDPLEDFPYSERWRLVTDAWQHIYGPKNFREEYYKGMFQAFDSMLTISPDKLTADTIINLWEAAFRFEKDYAEIKKVNTTSVRNKVFGHFSIGFNQNNHVLAVSQKGLEEFADELMANYLYWRLFVLPAGIDKNSRDKLIKLCVEHPNESEYFNPKNFQNNKAKIIVFLQKIFFNPKSDVMLMAMACPPKFLVQSMNSYLERFNKTMVAASNVNEKIVAIAKLIQRLNLLHAFPDGNGRVIAFLLQNFLLRKHLQCMAFTFTPSHFSGFSSDEMVEEVQRGIAEFNKYKITRARIFLENNNLAGDEKNYPAKLAANLSKENIIAMAQINELYLRVKDGRIKPPGDAKDEILKILKDLYMANLADLAAHPPQNEQEKIANPESLLGIIKNHAIINDFDKSQEDAINKQVKLYFAEPTPTSAPNKQKGSDNKL